MVATEEVRVRFTGENNQDPKPDPVKTLGFDFFDVDFHVSEVRKV